MDVVAKHICVFKLLQENKKCKTKTLNVFNFTDSWNV